MADNKTQIIITAKDLASSAISTISKNLKALSGTSLEVGKSMLGAAAGVAGIAGGIGMMDAAINGYIAQENAVKQMEARLKSTGMAAGYNSQQLQDMATALQKTTTFGDDATISAQALMLTFTKISGPVFGDAIAAAQNMSVALGQDLNGSVLQLGKALNDPIKGITALSRAGVSFTEGQKATIKSLVESGDLLGAQTIILKELEVEFGGAATAARDTLGGALTSLGNTVGDLLENMVGSGVKKGGLVGAINSLNEALANSAPALAQTGGVLSRVWDGFVEDMVKVDIMLSRIKGGAYQGASIVGGPWRQEMLDKGGAWFAYADRQSAWRDARRAGEMPGPVLDASEMGRLHAMQGVASKHGSGDGAATRAGAGATKKDNFTVDAPGYMNWRREADMIKQEAAYIEQLIKDQEAAMGSITVDDPGFMGWKREQGMLDQESAYIKQLESDQKQAEEIKKRIYDASAFGGLMNGLTEYATYASEIGHEINYSVTRAFQGMTDALTNFVTTGKANFSDLANSIISDMVRISIQQSITGPLASAAGSFFSGLFAEKGMAIQGGVQKFSSGGLVLRPTFFGMQNGLGMMGEAGPEAIMPLTRTASGHLGVRTDGGGSQAMNVQVNVINQTSQQVSAKTGNVQFDGRRFVIDTILQDVAAGGSLRGLMAGRAY